MGARARWAHLLCAAVAMAAIAQPAQARRRFFFGGGGGYQEKIDRVYDLPDRAPYLKDGEFLDLGYFYRNNKRFGITTSSTRDHGDYVLYHGDAYVKLPAELETAIAADLGFDPIARHRAEMAGQAAAERAAERPSSAITLDRRPGETTTELRARLHAEQDRRAAATPTGVDADSAGSHAGFGAFGTMATLLALGLLFNARRITRAVFSVSGALASAGRGDRPAGVDGFEQRVADRLRELEACDAAQPVIPAPAALSPAAPPARGFGRRGLA